MKMLTMAVTAATLLLAITTVRSETDRKAVLTKCVSGSSIDEIASAPACLGRAVAARGNGAEIGCRTVVLHCGGVQHFASYCHGRYFIHHTDVAYPLRETLCTGVSDHLVDFSRCRQNRSICERQIRPLSGS